MHNAAMITIEQLRETRVRLGESQAAFGARFGVDQSTVHRWETDGIPHRGATRVAIERVLGDLDVTRAASQ